MNQKIFIILWLFVWLFLSGCQNVYAPHAPATQIASGSREDINIDPQTSKSDNTDNIYIYGYKDLVQNNYDVNIYYGNDPIYITNISWLDIKWSDWLNISTSGNIITIKPSKSWVLTIKSNTNRSIDYGNIGILSGKNFTINFYPIKYFGSFWFYKINTNERFGYDSISNSNNAFYNYNQIIPLKTSFEFWISNKYNENINSWDIKFAWLLNQIDGTGGIKLLDFLKFQNTNITSLSWQEYLKNIHISNDAKKLNYSISGDSIYTKISNSKTWDTIILIDRFGNIYMIWISFANLSTNISYQNEYRYALNIYTNYPISKNNINKQLDTILWSGTYDISFNNNNWADVTYRPIPGKTYSWSLIITDIFWQTSTSNINIYHKTLQPQYIDTQIAGNSYNILPTKWSYSQFFVNYKNLTSRKYKISTCGINFKWLVDFSGNDFGKWYNMENYLLDCASGSIYTGTFLHSGNFNYRKTYTAKLAVPDSITGSSYYKLEILSGSSSTEKFYNNLQKIAYFSKTNIWLTSKISSGYIYIRPVYLDSGKFVTSGSIYIYDVASGSQTQKLSLGKIPIIIPNTGNVPKIISAFDQDNNKSLIVVWANGSNYYNWLSIESYIDSWSLLDNKYKNWWYDTDNKIYGYTDRWLYKPSDDIYFNWFVRNNNNKIIPKWEVTITIQNPQDGSTIYTSSGIKLDSFWGFKWKYNIPANIKLSDYFVQYQFGDITNSANIKILEYQKPTYGADINFISTDDKYKVSVLPKYYFWQNLTNYNIKTTINIQSQKNNYRRNQNQYYYNIDQDIYIWDNTKKFSDINQSNEYTIDYNMSGDINIPVESNLYINTQIFDNKSNEIQTFEKYIDIKPPVMIWLNGQYQDWSDKPNFTINGQLSGKSEYISDINQKYNLTYDIYYKDWNQSSYNGVDGSIYYSVNGQYQIIKTWAKVNLVNNQFDLDIKTSKAWEYLIKVYIKDNSGKVISVNSKYMYYYNWSNNDNMMWLLPNNYQMQLKVEDKMYEFGDKVKLNLMPYIKWSKAIITIEKNNEILDNFNYDLNWQDIYIPIRKGYEPNVNIYINQIAGSDIDLWVRKEPRFLAGMTNIDVDSSSNKLNIDIKTDKTEYKPWDMVNMKIKTTDNKGNPVESRLSVAVVDKSLNDMYNYIKEPLEYFYRKSISMIGNYSNLKLLYLSLKTFIWDGAKWGWGWWPTSFSAIRNDLSDLAFWRSDIISTWWMAEFSFKLPDNLTTRDTEVIWITKDTKLWVAKTEFLTTKDLIVEPNLPLFMTIGDKLTIPTKIILNPKNTTQKWEMVKLTAKLISATGWETILSNITLPVNKTALLPITIPYDLYDTDIAKIYISAQYSDFSDTLIANIPIRKDWFTITNIYNQPLSKKGSININNTSIKWKIETSISWVPMFDINNILRYLLHYPYWCTEQLASGLFPILYARITNPKFVDKLLINDDNVYINNSWNNIYTLTTNTITKILKNQNSDWGFGYRWTDASNYDLSAYIYNILSIVDKNKFAKDINLTNNISKVEKYLQNTKTEPSWYMYYIYYKAMNWDKISSDTIASLQNMSKWAGSALSAKILLNYISAKNNGKIIYNITTGNLNQYDIDKWYTYNNFLDKYILASIQLRSLIINKSASQDINNIYNYIINGKASDYYSLRWRSTQTNINVMLAINDYTSYILQNIKDINCKINIWNSGYNVVLDKDNLDKKYSLTYQNSANTDVSRNCDAGILVNITDNFVNINPKTIDQKNNWVKNFYLNFDNNKKIGSIIYFTWGFTLTENSNQLAVEYFIPSDTKLLYNIQSKNTNKDNRDYYGSDLPFDFGENYRCRPSYWQVKFDRLFLYYDNLAKDTTCKFTIKGIKSFDWVSNLQPSKIWEMYSKNINWTFVKQK